MKIVIFAMILVASQAISFFDLASEEWNLFKLMHKKHYKSDIEEKFRMKIFLDNKRKIAKHNSRYHQGLEKFKLGVNHLADMLPYEIAEKYNGFNKSLLATYKPKLLGSYYIPPANVELPREIDWRANGAVTPVKDQKHCRSCWAFSTTGALEGQHFRKTGKLVSLSEQNLIDCSKKYGNNGCSGGWMDKAFQYIKDNHGIDTERSYPYEGIDNECRYKSLNKGADDTGFVDIPEGNEHALKSAIATRGPVAVVVDAHHHSFHSYSEGVYSDPDCSSTQLDHAVLVVGYGTTDGGDDYWLVKNSWGKHWGLDGYIKMARNQDNACGIATRASFPLV